MDRPIRSTTRTAPPRHRIARAHQTTVVGSRPRSRPLGTWTGDEPEMTEAAARLLRPAAAFADQGPADLKRLAA